MAKSIQRTNIIFMVVYVISMILFVANADPAPLQDFCIGVPNPYTDVFVNGYFCKNPEKVTTNDFLYHGFDTKGDTNNALRSKAQMVNATIFPALNTLGLTIARIDFEAGGVNPPHLHPRASEVLTVLEGTLYAGFVTSNQPQGGNRLFATVLKKGDIFVFPQGLIHFQRNIGSTPAVANAVFSSQTPGLVTVANALLGSTPPIEDVVLANGFQVDEKVIEVLRSQFHPEGY